MAERAEGLAGRTYELVSFLSDVAKVKNIDKQLDASVTYHDSCSGLRELDIKAQPRQLLRSMEGIELKEMDNSEICCGFGGTF